MLGALNVIITLKDTNRHTFLIIHIEGTDK